MCRRKWKQRFRDNNSKEFKSKIEQLIQEIKNDGAMFPGEIEQVKEERNSIEGVKLEDDVYEELKEIGREYGIGIEYAQ